MGPVKITLHPSASLKIVTGQPPISLPSPQSHPGTSNQTWILFLSFCLLTGMFYGLYFLDRPTLIIVHGFTDPWIDEVGDIGNALGKGVTLVLISLGIGATGLWLNSHSWKFAGLYSLLAHGLSGLLVQILKHSLGRPRPRLMDTTQWEVGPSFLSGLDSFPSGHTTASFSVATVLAYYFPGARNLWFFLAGFVAVSRVIKGSHFPTDVLGGILVGIGSGLLVVYSRNKWKEAASHHLVTTLPWLVTAFGVLWILIPHPGIELKPDSSLYLASTLVMTGLAFRLIWCGTSSSPRTSYQEEGPAWPRVLMGIGLASSTGSLLIVGYAMMTGLIWWMGSQSRIQDNVKNILIAGLNPLWSETMIGILMFLFILLIFTIRSTTFLNV